MSPTEPSDEALIKRLGQDDEHALEKLIHRYRNALIRFSLALIGRRDLAEEAVANVFLNIWRRRQRLKIKSSVRSYLFSATGNQSVNLSKSQNQQGTVHLDWDVLVELADATQTDTPILFEEFRNEIDQLLKTLPERRQLIFRLNRLEGLGYAEIASKLGLSVFTVQNHMIQAMKQLAGKLPEVRANLT